MASCTLTPRLPPGLPLPVMISTGRWCAKSSSVWARSRSPATAPRALPKLTDALEPLIPHHDAILMANHGVVTFGSSLENAYMKMETVEHFAKIALVTHLLGNEQPLGEKEVEKLHEVRHRYNGGGTPTAPRLRLRPVLFNPTCKRIFSPMTSRKKRPPADNRLIPLQCETSGPRERSPSATDIPPLRCNDH
jgi:hypothetical protein